MDRANKYYSLIENTIKEHRKFSGLEPILEDIIDDVYLHSESVINNIDDEDVIRTYINKVVATSIITVPKKLDFHKEIPHKNISTQEFVESVFYNEKKADVNKELVDKMINSAETASESCENNESADNADSEDTEDIKNTENADIIESESVEEPIAEEANTEEMLEIEDTDSINYSDVSEIENLAELDVEESNKIDDNEDDDELIIELPAKEESNEGDDFVFSEDEIVSETATEIENPDNSAEDEPSFELIDETADNIENDIETTDNNINYNEENAEEFSLIETDEITSASETDTELELTQEVNPEIYNIEIEDTNNSDSDSTNVENIEEFASIEQEPETKIGNDTSINDNLIVENSDSVDFDINYDNAIEGQLIEPYNNDVSEFDEILPDTENDILEDNFVIDEVAEEPLISDENDDSSNNKISESFQTIDYSVFDYTQKNNDNIINTAEIEKSLQDLSYERPDLKIAQIFDLRFNQNKTIMDIAVELNLDAQKVVDALNEISSLV